MIYKLMKYCYQIWDMPAGKLINIEIKPKNYISNHWKS